MPITIFIFLNLETLFDLCVKEASELKTVPNWEFKMMRIDRSRIVRSIPKWMKCGFATSEFENDAAYLPSTNNNKTKAPTEDNVISIESSNCILDQFEPQKRTSGASGTSNTVRFATLDQNSPANDSFGSGTFTIRKSIFKTRYKYIDKLGSGGFGKVMLVQNKLTKQLVAVKRISIIWDEDDEDDKVEYDKLLREADLWEQMGCHENIVKFYRHWIEKTNSVADPKYLYIEMEHCPEGDLRNWLDKNKDPKPEDQNSIMKQMIRGIAFLHEKGLIHRDLKPANIFVTQQDNENLQIKVGDFGHITANNSKTRTRECGTSWYRSPEIEDDNHYDHKVDIFSLGMIIIELFFDLTDQGDRREKLGEAKNGNVQDFKYKSLVKKMLNHDPGIRPEAEEILDLLKS